MQAAPDVLVPQQTSLPIPEVLQAPSKLNDAPGTQVPIPTLPFITTNPAPTPAVVPIPTVFVVLIPTLPLAAVLLQ